MKILLAFLSLMLLTAGAAYAAGPQPWQLGFGSSATPVMDRLNEFHDMLLVIITVITIFVLALLVYVIFRFSAKRNPTPSRTTHNILLEIVWTVVPIVILVVICLKSLPLLYYMDHAEEAEMRLKVTGYQWYWGYEYPDQGGINFLSNMIPEKEIDKSKGQKRLLSTDNPVVIPVDTTIELQVTANDVLHSFAMPSFGVKTDAVPMRLNGAWIRVTKPGIYYGQCSEICGTGHAYMPIEFHAVSKDEFADWVLKMKKEQGIADAAPPAAVPASATMDTAKADNKADNKEATP